MYIVSLEYKVSLDQVDKYLEAHKRFLEDCYKKNIFIASGRKVPRTGGIIIASSPNREALEAVLAKDPFRKHQIADYQITEFIPTMHQEQFAEIASHDAQVRFTS